MMKRWLISVGILASLVAAGFGVGMMLPARGVTRANFDQIKKGMALAEVEAILGGPLNHLTIPPPASQTSDQEALLKLRYVDWYCRGGNGGPFVMIAFHDNEVVATSWQDSAETAETVLEKLRRWLGIQRPLPLPPG